MAARETQSNEVVNCDVQYVPGVEVTCVVAHVQHVVQVDGVDGVVQQEQVHLGSSSSTPVMNEARIKVHQSSFQVYQLRCEVRNDIVKDNLEEANEVARE